MSDEELLRLLQKDDKIDAKLKKMFEKYENFFDCEFDPKFIALRKKRSPIINRISQIYKERELLKENKPNE